MNYRNAMRFALIAGGAILLSACTRSVSQVDSAGKTENPIFPEASGAVRTEGSFVNLDNLKQMRSGLTKAQVYELIGTPHFKEGMFRVREWDYIFHFTRADNTVLTCQYKVLFDSDMTAQSFYFQPQNCLAQLNNKKTVPIAAHQEINAESLFRFGSAELSPAGIEQVQYLAHQMQGNALNGKKVVVTGYTDRIGQPSTNLRLSQARANSVRAVLIAQGVPAAKIETLGKGDANPRVTCAGPATSAVKACLAPNRRMTLDVVDDAGR